MKGGDAHGDEAPKKKKRAAPAHSKIQTEVLKMIVEVEKKNNPDFNYRDAIKSLKKHVSKAIGMSWDDAKAKGTMTWMEALEKTKAALKN